MCLGGVVMILEGQCGHVPQQELLFSESAPVRGQFSPSNKCQITVSTATNGNEEKQYMVYRYIHVDSSAQEIDPFAYVLSSE